MTAIDTSIRPVTYQGAPADGQAPVAPQNSQPPVPGSMSVEGAADAQAHAARRLASSGTGAATGPGSGPLQTIPPGAAAQLLGALPDLESSQGIDIYAITALLRRSHQEMATAARQIRATELDAQFSELMAGADATQKSADLSLVAGIAQGSVQLAAGALQAGSNARAAAQAAKATAPSSEIPQYQKEATAATDRADAFSSQAKDLRIEAGASANPKEVASLLHKADIADAKAGFERAVARDAQANVSSRQSLVDQANEGAANMRNRGEAGSKLLSASGEMVTAGLRHAAASADVAKRHEARAKLHEAGYSQANDKLHKESEALNDIKETCKDIVNSATESSRAIARNI